MPKIKLHELDYYYASNVHTTSRSYIIDEEITSSLTRHVIKTLSLMDQESKKPITIFINSPGGDIVQSLAIYDFIVNLRSFVTMIVYGQAASGASLILQAADKRIISSNSNILVHYGHSNFGGPYIEEEGNARYSKNLRERMGKIYLNRICKKNPKFTPSDLNEILRQDTTFFAKEAIEIGLADEIAKRRK